MQYGVPRSYESPAGDSLAASRRPLLRAGRKTLRAGALLLGSLSTLIFASSALGAPATVGLGTAASFSVLAGSTVTNTGPTTMFGDLGLSPGSSVTGAPHVLGATHVDDAVAIGAKNALTTGYNDAASRPSNGSAGTDLAGRTFSPGVYTASSSLLLSSGAVTLDAQGDPNAVFIFQIGSTLKTGSNTRGPGHQRRPGLQRLLAGRLLRDAGDGHGLRGHDHGRREHHGDHGRHDPRQAAGPDRRGDAGHQHHHQLQLRLERKRQRRRHRNDNPRRSRHAGRSCRAGTGDRRRRDRPESRRAAPAHRIEEHRETNASPRRAAPGQTRPSSPGAPPLARRLHGLSELRNALHAQRTRAHPRTDRCMPAGRERRLGARRRSAESRAGHAAARGSGHGTPRLPDASSGSHAGRGRARQPADHRRADHATRGRPRDRSRQTARGSR